ncbi:unnamed protein product [Gulo gulo]|uniref:Uncharacterized protein n=1 Tax=Gulo gulo TaxID=48420 RepID=A0A9X9M6N3_GULGU|nr:unnamed protein product [Gulo gulo]
MLEHLLSFTTVHFSDTKRHDALYKAHLSVPGTLWGSISPSSGKQINQRWNPILAIPRLPCFCLSCFFLLIKNILSQVSYN